MSCYIVTGTKKGSVRMIKTESFYQGSVAEIHPCEFGFDTKWGQAKQILLNDNICIWYQPVLRSTVTIERIKLARYYQYRVVLDMGAGPSRIYRVEKGINENEFLATQVNNVNGGTRIWNLKESETSWPR
jgi:hypothetical protein